MVATKIYIKTEPNLLAPTPSNRFNLVKDNIIPKAVAIVISQKNSLENELNAEDLSEKISKLAVRNLEISPASQ
jgi:hypothetical protein